MIIQHWPEGCQVPTDGTLRNGVTDDMVDARAAEILADDNELTNAAAEDSNIHRALCHIVRINMDRTSWPRGGIYADIVTPPHALTFATTALRIAISEYACRELEKRMPPEVRDIILSALRQYAGDDSARAQMAFKNCTPAQMQEQYGESGSTRQEILDGYAEHNARVHAARDWVRNHK